MLRIQRVWPLAGLTVVLGCQQTLRLQVPEGLGMAPVCMAETIHEKPGTDAVDPVSAAHVVNHYTKAEHKIPMRDGVVLHTTVYRPKAPGPHPVLLRRTPYGCTPYGADAMPTALGPSPSFMAAGYIFVCQDVRGAYMSGGEFVDVRPHRPDKSGPQDIDESSDTYDTITWLIANVPDHNGRVGMYGISYPGFYAAMGLIDAHPALRAVSPQAPVSDWFFDDFHHHGAFFLPHAFNFFARFGLPRPEPRTENHPRFDHKTPDGYQFFLDIGPLANLERQHLRGQVGFWRDLQGHPNYDEFWRARNILPHLQRVTPAVMTVGGWFDAEDLYGPLQVYAAIERQNPGIDNMLVMGPWSHGQWGRDRGEHLGDIHFGSATSMYYQESLEFPFFEHHLRGTARPALAEATVFETGANRWREFASWPPSTSPQTLFFGADGSLVADAPTDTRGLDEFISDPARPVPFTQEIHVGLPKEYMTEDQRFAARRPDVLVYQTEVLAEDLTLAGPISAELWVSTSETDADWVVKVIDVFPPDAEDPPNLRRGVHMGGYQMMVRSEVIRGRFRDGYEQPRPFTPGQATRVVVPLQAAMHTFRRGHRVMVQVQSTWFPLVDRNPQRYVANIFEATAADFRKATHRVHRSRVHASKLTLPRLVGTLGQSAN